jgi:hypothetical protein
MDVFRKDSSDVSLASDPISAKPGGATAPERLTRAEAETTGSTATESTAAGSTAAGSTKRSEAVALETASLAPVALEGVAPLDAVPIAVAQGDEMHAEATHTGTTHTEAAHTEFWDACWTLEDEWLPLAITADPASLPTNITQLPEPFAVL